MIMIQNDPTPHVFRFVLTFFSDLACSGVLADAGTPRPVSGQNFQKRRIRKNIESGLKQVAVPPFEAISIAIDAGAPPAPFSQESGSLGLKRAQNP